jgi:hypothetical protein
VNRLELTEEVAPIQQSVASDLVTQEESPADLRELIALLQHEADLNRKRFRLWLRFLVGVCAFVVTLCFVLLLVTKLTGRHFEPGWAFGLFGLIGPGAIIARSTRSHKYLAKEVARCNDLRALGPLIDSLNIHGLQVQGTVCEAVTRILSRMDRATVAQLTTDQVGMLNYQLRRAATDALVHGSDRFLGFSLSSHRVWQNRMQALLIEIIKSAPLFGNRETLKLLKRLGTVPGRPGFRTEVRSAAVASSNLLRARLEAKETEEQLLRPAGAPGADALLRPAAGISEARDEQLLRPASQDL